MFCKYCGKKIDDDSMFCKFCGKNLNSNNVDTDSEDDIIFEFDDENEEDVNKNDQTELLSGIKDIKSLAEFNDNEDLNDAQTVKFGRYYIGDLQGNNKEDIEWYVLSKEPTRALLVSKYILDYIKFDSNFDYKNVDYSKSNIILWKDCTLRNWLNKTFYDEAFNESEKVSILETELQNSPRTTKNNTKDKIFCLSLKECKTYMKNKRLANRLVSAYANAKDGEYHYLNEETGMGHYRLRDVDTNSSNYPSALYVDCDSNDYFESGCGGDDPNIGICPAMWIKM